MDTIEIIGGLVFFVLFWTIAFTRLAKQIKQDKLKNLKRKSL